MNAESYQQGWIEWKTKSNGRKACRFRYWVRDESKPGEWRKAATAWEEGLTAKQAGKRLRDLMTAMGRERPKAPAVAVAKKGLTLKQFVESHWETYQTNRGIRPSTRDSQAATLKNHILPVLGSVDDSLRKYTELGQIRAYVFNGVRVYKLEELDSLIDRFPRGMIRTAENPRRSWRNV